MNGYASSERETRVLRAVAETLPDALLVTDATGQQVLFANERCQELWRFAGTPALADVQQQMRSIAVDPDTVTRLWEERWSALQRGEPAESHLLLSTGSELRWTTRALRGPDGEVWAATHQFEATTPAPPDDQSFVPIDGLFRLTFEKAAVGMALIASDYRILRVNSSFAVMLGYTETELAALSLADLIYADGTQVEESLPEGRWTSGLPGGQDTLHLDRRFQRRDGQLLWVHLSLSVVRDALGQPVYLVAMAEDITERKREEAERDRHTRELQALASTDPLTGVYNHRFMQECLHRRVAEARQSERSLSVLMLDLDHFRELNEEYGHDVGDRALRRVADAMRRALRPSDVACRYGGEEFVMILPNAEFPSALAVAERIRRGIESSELVAVGARSVTCSIGVATFPTHASTPTSLLKAADLALFQAKRSGRNRVCGYQPTPVVSPADHLDSLCSGLRDATPEAVSALMTAIDLRDRYTGAHCQRVARLSLDLAALLDCSHGEREILRLGAPLLDVGKIGLPDQILTKSGKLTVEDWELMRQHPIWGEQLVLGSALPGRVADLVRWHHERLDGSGYPDGLEGDQIPLIVRIAGVADVAVALLGDRPHRRAWPHEQVMEFLERHAGASLDAEVVEAYRELQQAA